MLTVKFADRDLISKRLSAEEYNKQIKEIAEIIKNADAVVVGGGSGVSSAAGYNHYHRTPLFDKYFSNFEEAYGFTSMLDGYYYLYSTNEERWAYYSQYIKFMYEAETGKPYTNLYEILKDKEYFIITTNVDMQFSRVFPEDKICLFQGDSRYFQCSQPCHDKLYDNKELIYEMNKNIEGTRIPSELVPRCPECGRVMIPWVRDYEFLEGQFWKDGKDRYEEFLNKYKDSNIVFLELGVGDMTPSVIKLPFWQMTFDLPKASMVTVDRAKAEAPEHIKDKCIACNLDIAEFTEMLKKELAD